MTENSLCGFCPDVFYSLNESCVWPRVVRTHDELLKLSVDAQATIDAPLDVMDLSDSPP